MTSTSSRLMEMAAATPPTRDRYADLLRAFSICVISAQHRSATLLSAGGQADPVAPLGLRQGASNDDPEVTQDPEPPGLGSIGHAEPEIGHAEPDLSLSNGIMSTAFGVIRERGAPNDGTA